MNKNIFILSLFILISSFSVIFAENIDLNQYQYVSKIKVNCDEYKGYVKVEVPKEYLSKENMNSYFTVGNFFIDKGYSNTNYLIQNYWYVENIENAQIRDIENIFDSNKNSYMLFETGKSEFVFKNPKVVQTDKIIIYAKDSQIDEIKLYSSSGSPISFILKQNNFDYELFLDKSYNSNEIDFKISSNNLLKLSEVSFYKKQETNENTYLYFYLDNKCNTNFSFYFGKFGKNFAKYNNNNVNIPINFPVQISTNLNTLYNNDFDNDTIINNLDNCLSVSNVDQKDINYNKFGDACEDSDSDGVVDANDNCVNIYNRDQLDNDKDGIGNVCDSQDDRFFEKNIIIVYMFTGLIAVLFIWLTIKLIKSENKKK